MNTNSMRTKLLGTSKTKPMRTQLLGGTVVQYVIKEGKKEIKLHVR